MSPTIEPIVCPYDPTWVMAYYVDAPRPALVDTGGGRHPTDAIQPALAARGTTLAAIEVIINTHGHWDHAGGNAAVAVACSPEILVHAAGAPLLVDERPHLDGYLTDTARLLEQPALAAAQRATFPDFFQRGPAGTRLLGDGDRIDLGAGVMFDVLHAPGHSNDHVALFWEREGGLVAGDTAQGTGSRLGGCPLYFGSTRQARTSIARLRDIPFRTLHVSHPFGRPGTDERVTAYDGDTGRAFLTDSLSALDAMEEALRVALDDDPATPFPVLARAATDHLAGGGRWPLWPEPMTGVPTGAAPTLHGLRDELNGASP